MKFKSLLVASAIALASATSAQAADIAVRHKAAPIVIVPAFSWEGFYIGAQAGYGFGKAKSDYLIKKTEAGTTAPFAPGFTADFTASDEGDLKGFVGGLYAGYSIPVVDDAIIGVETDFAFNKAEAKFTKEVKAKYRNGGENADDTDTDFNVSGETKTKWSGATRLRVGYALDRILPYLAGGVTYTNFETSGLVATKVASPATPVTIAEIAKKDHTLIGWTAGAGIDYAAMDNVVVRLEYRYNDFGTKDLSVDALKAVTAGGNTKPATQALSLKKQFNSSDVRVGIAYKF